MLWVLGLGALSASALAVGACSGSEAAWDGGVDATADAPKNDATTKNDAIANNDATADDAATGDDGAAEASSADLACATDDAGCENCCFNNHVDGGNTYFGALVTCACTTGAKCHSVAYCYGNLCKGNAISQSCDNCLSNPDAGDCYNKADQACANDPDCVGLFDCLGNVCAPPPPADASAD